MKKVLSIIILFFSVYAKAGDIKYPVSTIPENLKKDANAVKRMEKVEFQLLNSHEGVFHYVYAITILNENGDDYAAFSEYYDKFRHINNIDGSLYDASGKLIKKLKAKDIKDLSAVQSIDLMDDYRIKSFEFYWKEYPYTIEFEADIKYNQTFTLPYWVPMEHHNLSVESSSFTVTCPVDYTMRYRNLNYNGEPRQTTEKNKKIYQWEVQQLPAIKREYAAPLWQEIVPMVSLAPTEFQIDDYKGTMYSWKDFGKFMYELKIGRDQLPEDIRQKVIQLTSGATTDREKVVILYHFLQQNTRYISVQLGIGGWQPFEAAYVAKKGYGDCKALSNYMHSLLKAVGIKSYYTLIKGGDYDYYLMDDFPSNQFNHATLCVPLQKDTMWLECTDQTGPAGYQGNFTGNRKALLIDEGGGVIVKTTMYGLNENTQIRKINGAINEDGSLDMNVNTEYRAIQQDKVHDRINYMSNDKIKEVLNEELGLPTYTIKNFKYTEKKESMPDIKEQLDIGVDNYATISGKRIFITPNILNRSSTKLDEDEDRKFDIELPLDWRDVDTVEITIPQGYIPENIPRDVSVKTKFGFYNTTMVIRENKILYVRVNEQYSGHFPAKDFKEFARFCNDKYKSDRSKIVLVKKTE
jgi:hypothetical protein